MKVKSDRNTLFGYAENLCKFNVTAWSSKSKKGDPTVVTSISSTLHRNQELSRARKSKIFFYFSI